MLILNHTDPLDHLFTSGFAVQTCHKFRSICNWRLITIIEGLSLQCFRSYDKVRHLVYAVFKVLRITKSACIGIITMTSLHIEILI